MTGMQAHRHKCVVVDDDAGVRALLYSILGECNLDLRGFGSAAEAIEACHRDPPDYIILDIVLRGSDAVDVLRALATQNYRGAVQLISGRDLTLLKQVTQVGEQHGLHMVPPLHKPFHIDDVEKSVIDYFAAHPAGAPSAAPAYHAEPPPLVTLKEALRNGWLEFYWQPKISLRERCVVGAELLARCRHPEFGMIAPNAFIPHAGPNETLELSTRAMAAALSGWRALPRGGAPLKLAINVTVDDLLGLPIAAIVREHRPRDPGWPGLILEVTEDQAVRDVALTQEIATQLRIYDIALALDDFGAGYSNLARLKQLPFAELKLDRQTVAGCDADASSAALCQMSIDLAHQLGAVAVGEGIETRGELQALIRMGCDLGQGFLLAAPMPQDRFVALLRENIAKARVPA
jgi:EAL domain-containing protein (putative c-di-GMP-specific phosphodiesterase class I)/ActR/RegA family two-component response regulator